MALRNIGELGPDADHDHTFTREQVLAARARPPAVSIVARSSPRPARPAPTRTGQLNLSPGPLVAYLEKVLGGPLARGRGAQPGTFSHHQAAMLCGVGRDSITAWVSGKRSIPRMRGDEIATRLGVHPEEIWPGEWSTLSDIKNPWVDQIRLEKKKGAR